MTTTAERTSPPVALAHRSAGEAEATASASATDWRRRYARGLWITDLLAITWVVFGTQILWFGIGAADVTIRADGRLDDFSYWYFSLGLVIAWMWSLSLGDARKAGAVGSAGPAEYSRVVRASVALFGAVAIGAFLLRIDVARGFLLVSLPLGVATLLLSRWLWRRWLVAMRATGRYSARVLLVGTSASVSHLAQELRRNPGAGYHVVGACIPAEERTAGRSVDGVQVVGTVDSVHAAMHGSGADTVAVTNADELSADRVKRISWGLRAGREHLVVAPSLVDVAGPRIHVHPVAGLPLIHVEVPRFSTGQRVVKRAFDVAASATALLLLSPVLLCVAIAVRTTSRGPVLFRQVRVGAGGAPFTMVKFRSMVVDAEALLEGLRDADRDVGNEVLFKMRDDPRVTRVGRFIRRYSLDELPQLLNVLGGSMSLVGPRPPLASEVAQYADHVHRRFLMKPGITGLWQVSGRSTLSWDDSVRLDLSYVENWSLTRDVGICLRTLRVIVAPGGRAL